MHVTQGEACEPYPRLFVADSSLTRLLQKNEQLIRSGRPILEKVFKQLGRPEKAILLCDKHGYIVDLTAEITVLQELIEHGVKLGVSLSAASCGTNAVGKAMQSCGVAVTNTEEHEWRALRPWTCIAAPIVSGTEQLGFVCIALKIEGAVNHCKIVVELISDYVTALLEQKHKAVPDKRLFFGALILDNRKALTPREIEVLYLLRCGVAVSGLPMKLQLSPNTVKSHLKHIYGKLEVSSLAQALDVIDKVIAEVSCTEDES